MVMGVYPTGLSLPPPHPPWVPSPLSSLDVPSGIGRGLPLGLGALGRVTLSSCGAHRQRAVR